MSNDTYIQDGAGYVHKRTGMKLMTIDELPDFIVHAENEIKRWTDFKEVACEQLRVMLQQAGKL